MRKLFEKLGETLRSGEDAVLVTIIASSGSTPRGAGARMLITKKGRIFGTIGGGILEYKCELKAVDALKAKSSRKESFKLHENEIQDIGMICGGDVDIHFLFIKAGDSLAIALTDGIESFITSEKQLWLICEITQGHSGAMRLYSDKGLLLGPHIPGAVMERLKNKNGVIRLDGREYYCENIKPPGLVYIFGGGHVTQALVPVLTSVDFRCVVLEDRDKLCDISLFPGAENAMMIDNNNIFDFISVTDDDYIVIMTRGHKHDQTILAQTLKTQAYYIGVIGSKQKAETVANNLREMGYTDQDLARVHSPIGLSIKAETPAEIAVSIASEMIMTRAR